MGAGYNEKNLPDNHLVSDWEEADIGDKSAIDPPKMHTAIQFYSV